MINFTYYTPTKVVFGKGTQSEVGTLAKEAGAKKVLVHYGSPRVEKTGLLDAVCASLDAENIPWVKLGGVVPNPRVDLVRKGVALCREEGVDFVLGVGGGSVIDSAKAIAYGVPVDFDVWEFYAGRQQATTALPVGAVVTIAAAGSEMSNSSVISNDETGEKRGYNTDLGRCRFAVMNPELTLTLPAYETACGICDILMHTLERYFTPEEPMETTITMAEALLRTVIRAGNALSREPQNYNARAEAMWAGSLSHNGLTGAGGGQGDWSSHQLGHEISGRYNTAHGAALTVVWGSWARYVYKANAARFARLAVEVLGLEDTGDDEETALLGIEEMENYFWALEMPTNFADAGLEISDEDLDAMAKGCSREGTRTIGAFKALDEADMRAIYAAALGE